MERIDGIDNILQINIPRGHITSLLSDRINTIRQSAGAQCLVSIENDNREYDPLIIMPKKKEIKYKDERAIRVLLDEDTEYYAVVLDVDTSWGVDVGAQSGVEKAKRKQVFATYIKDPTHGLLPEDLWKQQKAAEVAGTLSTHINVPFSPEEVTITSGVKPVVMTSCSKCDNSIISGSPFCRFCGAKL